jgi:hypothetical protein
MERRRDRTDAEGDDEKIKRVQRPPKETREHRCRVIFGPDLQLR